jgi:hypothetical protein
VEFSNIILLVVGLGVVALNPLFDVLAPKIAAFFRTRPRTTEPVGCG